MTLGPQGPVNNMPLMVPGENRAPDSRVVEKFHTNADTDSSKSAAHHTLGTSGLHAAAGNHGHNGIDSVQLLDGIELTGSKDGNIALGAVIAALVQLGAVDNTS